MIIDDIYKSPLLKYPLTREEEDLVPEALNFLDIFKLQIKNIFISDYRDRVIHIIKKKYTPDEFYKLEEVLNKLFWNLRWLIFPLWQDPMMTEDDYENFVKDNYYGYTELPYSLLLCKKQSYTNQDDLLKKIKDTKDYDLIFQSYRSFINKLIIVDTQNKFILTKPMEGSSHIFGKNYFNLYSMMILFNMSLYHEIMRRPYAIRNLPVQLSDYYYQYDYGFPNLNFCTYQFGTKKDRLERIKKMYYDETAGKHWFKLIY